jgi:hypothetical protein
VPAFAMAATWINALNNRGIIMNKGASILNKTFIFLNYVVNGNSCMYFELDKPLDTGVLQRALEILVEQHPLLNCRLAKTLLGYGWRTDPQLGAIKLQCQAMETADKGEILDRLCDNAWQRPFSLFKERHLRAYYLQTPKHCYVQLVPNHILADARSSDLLMAELAHIYDQLSKSKPISLQEMDVSQGYSLDSTALFARDLSFSKTLQMYLSALANIVVDAFRPQSGIAIAPRGRKSRKRGATRVLTKELDEVLIENMKSRLKPKGFTIHPALVLSVLRSVETYNARRNKATPIIRVSDMFSLAPFAQEDLTNVYDCFVVPFTSYYEMGGDDMGMLGAIRDEIAYFKKGGILRELFRQNIYTITGALSPKKLATQLVTRFIAKSNIVISNPGQVKFDIPDFGDAKIVSYTSFSQLFPPARIFFLFSGFRGKLRLNILYDENAFTAEEIEQEIYASFAIQLQQILKALGENAAPQIGKTHPEEVVFN